MKMKSGLPSESSGVVSQSGVIPVLDDKLVLITSRKSNRWIIPKGYVEKGLSPAQSAAKEALEEAGLIGSVHDEAVGSYSYRKLGKLFSVQVYPLYVETILDRWAEMHLRQRRLVTPAEALDLVCHEDIRGIISGFFANGR
ncbi:MAG: NUDIX hydrolase [Chlorobiaceae bacterium]